MKTFALTLRIDWSELDLFGHVNNVAYYKYIQSARVHIWDQTGLIQMYEKNKIGAMLASCKCDFKKPLMYPGTVRITSVVTAVNNTSFMLQHTLENDTTELCATAEDVVVVFDFNQHQKQPIPEAIRNELQ
jgi:acyl-CoA thioester hydrolase